jgi:AraC-like DNA-binding protein
VYLSAFNRFLAASYLIYYALAFVFSIYNYNCTAISLIIYSYVFIAMLSMCALIISLNSIRPDRIKFFLSMSSAGIMGLAFILEFISSRYGFLNSGLFTSHCSFPVAVIFMVLISRESMRGWSELDRLYEKLKTSGVDIKKTDNGDSLSITDESRNKLERVIKFINENYRSNLSREGLAAAVELSPNYMSRLFLTYTQKTINEYINHLRVGDAMESLGSSDKTVLYIALDIGYESLTTFNRVFKKVTGKTPTEYRSGL